MLRFMRNKLVSVEGQGEDTLRIRGVLDDDMYGVELDLTVDLSKMEIRTIEGKWNRWTTPECPRAVHPLKGALGLRILDRDFHQKVQKEIGRKACRHFANLLLECCHSAREAARLIGEEKEEGERAEPAPAGVRKEGAEPDGVPSNEIQGGSPEREKAPGAAIRAEAAKGTVIDLHVHTFPASPCGSASVDRIIEEARRIGLDGICLTDHNHTWDPDRLEALRRKHDFLVLGGNEITTDQGDTLVFGLEEDIKGIITLEELRDKVVEAGGFMIAAHPFRGFLVFGVGRLGLTPERAAERVLFRCVDGVEILNGKVTDKENAFASRVAASLGLPATGGSDAHDVSEVGLCATRFSRAVRDEEDLVEALKEGLYSPVAFRKERGD